MQFDMNRLRLGERIVAGAAVLLFIDMFLSWYSANLSGRFEAFANASGASTSASAWKIFSYTDLWMLLVIIVALALVVLRATERTPALPIAGSVILTALAGFVTLLVLYRIINQPGPNNLVNVEFGAYLGFLLLAALTYGGFRSMREEGTTFSDARAQAEQMVGSRGTTTPAPAEGGAPSSAPPASSAPASTPPASTTPPASEPGRPGDSSSAPPS